MASRRGRLGREGRQQRAARAAAGATPLKGERLILYCYFEEARNRWHLALRTPDGLLWRWSAETWPTREAVEAAALTKAAEIERKQDLPVTITFETPQILPDAVGVVEFTPDLPPNRAARRGKRSPWN